MSRKGKARGASDRNGSTVDQIILAIKQGVARADFLPGQRLVEPSLMVQFGVSRGPVREALRRLTADGLVEWERFRGASIVRMSRQQVREFGEIRAVIEGLAAGRAAARASARNRRAFAKLENIRKRVAGSPMAYDEYNIEFHDLILRLGCNSEIESFVERAKWPIIRLQFANILLSETHIRRSTTEHQKVMMAILNGDQKSAELAMRQHIQNSTQRILQAPDHYFSDVATRSK